MAEGHLKIMILKALYDSEHTGYSLMSYMEEISGRRPSSGSMYPALKDLSKKGQISARAEGKKKIYTITKKGKRDLDDLMKRKSKVMDYMVSNINAVTSIFGKLGNEDNIEMFRNIKDCGTPFSWLTDEMIGVRHEVLRVSKLELDDSKKEKVKKLLTNLKKELKKLK